jgi:hypothetical protein
MEPIQHAHTTRRKQNSAKVNVTISLIFHVLIFVAGAYWAAHEGVLGKKLQELSVILVPKEKKPEEKKAEPKVEQVKKIDQPKAVEQAKAAPAATRAVAPPPPAADLAAAAPPPAVLPSFSFSDGAREVLTSDDPVVLYKYQLETALRSKWERPTDVEDITYVAEAEMAVASSGQLLGYEWKKGSGDKSWDDSVRKALGSVKAINRAPPKGFPEKVIVRFDVLPATEPLVSRAD